MPEVVQKTGEDTKQQPNTPEVKTETFSTYIPTTYNYNYNL